MSSPLDKLHNKYKSVALSHDTTAKLDHIRNNLVPDTSVSRAKALEILINEKGNKLKCLKKYSNLRKIMGLSGTTMDEEATKQMGEYAKNPKSYLKDVNEMMGKLKWLK